MAYATDLTGVLAELAVVGLDASSFPDTDDKLLTLQTGANRSVRMMVQAAGVDPDGLTTDDTAFAALGVESVRNRTIAVTQTCFERGATNTDRGDRGFHPVVAAFDATDRSGDGAHAAAQQAEKAAAFGAAAGRR